MDATTPFLPEEQKLGQIQGENAEPSSTPSGPSSKEFVFSFRGKDVLHIPLPIFNVFLTIMTILGNLMMVVTLPLLSQSMTTANSTDEYPVLFFSSLWFPLFFFLLVGINKYIEPTMPLRPTVSHRTMILVGALNSMNGLLVVYASDPSRTSPQLQSILSTSIIPFTVICRFIILRKGVSRARLVCTGVVLIGLFISLEPVIFSVDQPKADGDVGSNSSPSVEGSSGISHVLWPFVFTLGFLPLGILNSILERELKQDETESLIFQAFVQLYSTIIIWGLFWTDFIPGFGAASSPREFWDNLSHGARCMYGQDPECSDAVLYSALFIIAYCLANLFIFLLVRFAEGAVYLVVVQALVTPLGALFWTLFSSDPSFHWHPVFNLATGFVLAGLLIMVPAVVMYNYFGAQERKAEEQRAQASASDD
ncbi:chloroquine resistance transporter-like [Diadema antillarum]|uniref:chloroquine resistance transporter-like n=1 Tax=Diadema antillarum TaxID=105358 RepID=UPI003A836EF8